MRTTSPSCCLLLTFIPRQIQQDALCVYISGRCIDCKYLFIWYMLCSMTEFTNSCHHVTLCYGIIESQNAEDLWISCSVIVENSWHWEKSQSPNKCFASFPEFDFHSVLCLECCSVNHITITLRSENCHWNFTLCTCVCSASSLALPTRMNSPQNQTQNTTQFIDHE